MDNSTPARSRTSINIDYRVIVVLLVCIMLAMLAFWRPWTATNVDNDRIITVTGETTLKAEPDEYVFYPSYEFKSADKNEALAMQTEKNQKLLSDLKALGIDESNIKNNSNGYNYGWTGDDSETYVLSLVITVPSKDTAQKIQDYLITTQPEGQVSPQASFSEAKRKSLESQARDAVVKDAAAKAEQSAKNTDSRLGKVKSIEDGNGFGQNVPYPLYESKLDIASEAPSRQSFTVSPGQNDLNYSVTVTYYLK